MKKRLASFMSRILLLKNWYRFIYPLNRNRYNVTAELRNGAKFILGDIKSDDYSTLLAVAGEDIYHFSDIPSPRIILDVGAHIGIFSILAARRFPNAEVIAVEPDERNYSLLVKNIELNGLTNVSAQNVAVAGDYGTVTFYKSKHSVAHSLFSDFDGISLEKKEVNTVPLSHFKNVDVLKFDAEGAEYMVKEFPPISYIAIEVHKVDGQDMQKLIETLTSRFHILVHKVEKTGHVTIVGVAPHK